MPVHNGMPFLEASVRSILGQSFGDFELVIGDDASSDGSSEVIRRLADSDERIRVLRRDRKSGLVGAANWVVSEARAPLVALAHADDISVPGRLASQMRHMSARPDAVLIGGLCRGIDAWGACVHPPNLWRVLRQSAFAAFAHPSIMFRRASFIAAGGYREQANYWEDLDLYWRLARLGAILVMPDVLVDYRYSKVSARMRDADRLVENALDRMYRSASLQADGEGPDSAPPTADDTSVDPRVFITRSWTAVWSRERSNASPAMMQRAA